jgi:hypothetical protein
MNRRSKRLALVAASACGVAVGRHVVRVDDVKVYQRLQNLSVRQWDSLNLLSLERYRRRGILHMLKEDPHGRETLIRLIRRYDGDRRRQAILRSVLETGWPNSRQFLSPNSGGGF